MSALERAGIALLVIYVGMLVYARGTGREFNVDVLNPTQLQSSSQAAEQQLSSYHAFGSQGGFASPAQMTPPATNAPPSGNVA